MSSILLDASRGARLLSGEYDYKNDSGSDFYYSDSQGVSSTSNLGTIAEGETLRRRAPSWVISAGQTDLTQTAAADTDDEEVEGLHVIGDAGEPAIAEGWTLHTVGEEGEPAFTNAWTGTATFVYAPDDEAVVVDVDVTHTGATTSAIFTLPAGYRPASQEVTGDLTINTDGTVVPSSSLDAVTVTADPYVIDTPPDTDAPAYAQDADQPASFFKDPFGIVHLQGRVTAEGGVTATSVFTLPAGYRPSFAQQFASNEDTSGPAIDEGGVVTVDPDASLKLFDGITFRAA